MAAKAQDNRFQNLTIDYRKVMNLSPTKRVELTDTSEGRSLLTSLTPQQLQTAFPYQYGRDDPTGEKLRSITTGKAQEPQPGDKPELSQSTREKLGGSRGRSDPGAKLQLTNEQRETLGLIREGKISADDPRVSFLKGLTDDDLKKSGIQIIDEGEGKRAYKAAPLPSDEEISVELKNRSSGTRGKNAKQNQQEAYATLRQEGLSDRGARVAVANLMGEGLNNPASFNKDYRADGSFAHMARGIAQWDPTRSEAIRKNFGKYPNEMTVAEQVKAMVWEMKKDNPGVWAKLKDDSLSDYERMQAIVKEYERPADWRGETAKRTGWINSVSVDPGYNIPPGQEPTAEQVAAYKQQIPKQQEEYLTGRVGVRQQQASAADVRVNRKSDTQAKVYYAGDSIGVGVGTQAGGIKLAQSGLKFTDPSILQQLAKVPKGSTVELHGGTNDAVAGITDPDAYREQMKRIAELARANGITVNVNGPPKTRKNWDPNAAAADSAMAAAAQEHGVSYRSLRAYTPPDKSDGVHFDNKGYQAMVRPLPAPEQQAQVQTESVPSMPDGGEMQTDADKLQVYALDKNKLQRDDSIAFDGNGKPQFTMNSKEAMKFDPNTGKVEVDNGSKGYRNNPNQLGPEKQQTQSEKNLEERNVPLQTQPAQPPPTSAPDSSGHNSMYDSVSLTENVFKSPSFERAIARTRFQNSGDTALGGHFDGGSYGMV
jgi:hypothetical protein